MTQESSSRRPALTNEALSWNPILELLEVSSILSRRQAYKHREVDDEEKIAREANKKLTQGHESERIIVEFEGIEPTWFFQGNPMAQAGGLSTSRLLGFRSKCNKWYVDVIELSEDKGGKSDSDEVAWSIPVEQLKDSRQIISFEVSPASRQE